MALFSLVYAMLCGCDAYSFFHIWKTWRINKWQMRAQIFRELAAVTTFMLRIISKGLYITQILMMIWDDMFMKYLRTFCQFSPKYRNFRTVSRTYERTCIFNLGLFYYFFLLKQLMTVAQNKRLVWKNTAKKL